MIGASLAAGLVGSAVFTVRTTIRLERRHAERQRALKARGVPFVYALWHGRMVLPILAHRHEQVVTMASRSKDGEIIARWLLSNGYLPLRGSTGKGGAFALQEMIDRVESGHAAALTVDGPKGPPRVVQPGVLRLARETGAWILPLSGSCARPWFLKSWDRYLAPTPFSRCIVVYGEPFAITPDVSDEDASKRIADSLDALTREADEAMGVKPPTPWEPVA